MAALFLAALLLGGVAGCGTGLILPTVLVPLIGAEAVAPVIGLSVLLTNAGRLMTYRSWPDRVFPAVGTWSCTDIAGSAWADMNVAAFRTSRAAGRSAGMPNRWTKELAANAPLRSKSFPAVLPCLDNRTPHGVHFRLNGNVAS